MGMRSAHCFVGGLLKWCGNAGWFPAYPWLIRVVAYAGLDHTIVAVALSWLFDLSAIVLLWVILDRRTDTRAIAVLVFASFAPGLVYDYAAFPLSMLAFLTLLYLWLIKTERWFFAGLVVFALVLTYPTGFAAPLAVAIVLPITQRAVPLGKRWRRVGLAAGPAVVALALLPVVQQHETGHWDAYYLAQVNFGHSFIDPFGHSWHAAGLLLRLKLFTLANAPYAQTLVVTFVVLCALLAVVFRWREVNSFERLVAVWMALTWLIPQVTSGLSQYRSEAALLPTAILVVLLPRTLAVALIAATIAVAIPMEVLFLRNTLV